MIMTWINTLQTMDLIIFSWILFYFITVGQRAIYNIARGLIHNYKLEIEFLPKLLWNSWMCSIIWLVVAHV